LALERCHFIGVLNLDVIITLLKSRINSAPKLSEVRETSGSHPNDEMFIFHIEPLKFLPSSSIWWALEIFEFILLVGSPSDLVLLDSYLCVITIRVLLKQLESIIEERFGNKTAWYSWIFGVKLFLFDRRINFLGIWIFLVLPKVSDFDNWVAIGELVNLFVVTNKLVVVAAFDVSSVILIEVI